MYSPVFLFLYELLWKGFECHQRRQTLLAVAGIKWLFVWCFINRMQQLRIKFPILLAINTLHGKEKKREKRQYIIKG